MPNPAQTTKAPTAPQKSLDPDPIVGRLYLNPSKSGGDDYISGRVTVKLPDGRMADVNFSAFKNKNYQSDQDAAYFVKRARKISTISTYPDAGCIIIQEAPAPPTKTFPSAQSSKFKTVSPKIASPAQPEYQDPDQDPM